LLAPVAASDYYVVFPVRSGNVVRNTPALPAADQTIGAASHRRSKDGFEPIFQVQEFSLCMRPFE
jgi:hypothetical protein